MLNNTSNILKFYHPEGWLLFPVLIYPSIAFFALSLVSYMDNYRHADIYFLLTFVTDDSTNYDIQRRRLVPQVASSIACFVIKFLAFVYLLFRRFGRVFSVRYAPRELEGQSGPHTEEGSAPPQMMRSNSQVAELEALQPCWQRLQHLETLVTELVNKPKKIPPEKEDILIESLSRIKSIEYDLQKTKKVRWRIFS